MELREVTWFQREVQWFQILMPLDRLPLVADVGGFVARLRLDLPSPEHVKLGPFLAQREDVAYTSPSGTVWKEGVVDAAELSVSLSSPPSSTMSSSRGTRERTIFCIS